MKQAIKQAKKAAINGDVPIGCVIVYKGSANKKQQTKIDKTMSTKMNELGIKEGQILARAYNKRNVNASAIAHAEILCINKACKKIKDYRLDNCEMYVTLEPCQMCAGAIVQSRIKKVYASVNSIKSGSAGSIINILDNNEFNHKVDIEFGLMEEESKILLSDFFSKIRNKKQ